MTSDEWDALQEKLRARDDPKPKTMDDYAAARAEVIRPPKAPVEYAPAVADAFLEHLATGLSVAKACREDGMPTERAIYLWLRRHEEFRKAYVLAKEQGLERIANEMLEIADACHDKDSSMAARVQIDARKWLLTKLKPGVYGDNLDVKHSGNVTITVRKFAPPKPGEEGSDS